ncbi:MAG: bifunctional methylenetetrahydrofolate dehydrogenase/methenyltetrahydrofolate cyclohydrolase [Burkholderiales bacterium]|nr:bifunctional methylenetetrahydrofolate dehydrogenase/methenyltetrahydrofolate cyclohydrolase [Burkholderiales bacterium]
MTARVLDGAAIARQVYSLLRQRVAALDRHGVRPGLAAVQVGDNPASRIYVRNKVRACTEAGLYSEVHSFDADCPESVVLATLDKLNRNPCIHGIIVQLPLPRSLDATRILQSIAVDKDVDGFNWRNLGALVDAHPTFVPCTPLGVMTMLDHAGIPVEGRNAVVVGRSGIIGKPMALLLIARGATVTVCNSKTADLGGFTARADILVVATGKAGLVDGTMVKPGAVVIDVGINRLPGGRLTGDVEYRSAREKASWITPVPGGVGPMTVAMLIANTVVAAERSVAVYPLATANQRVCRTRNFAGS